MPALTLYEKARALAALMVAAKCLNLYTFRCTTANSLSMQCVRREPAVPCDCDRTSRPLSASHSIRRSK